MGQALQQKLRDPKVWCEKLAVPSAAALQSAHEVLEGATPESPALHARTSRALPASVAALEAGEKQVHGVVTQCCVQPVHSVLGTYSETPEWTKADEPAEAAPPLPGSLLPLPCITAVGEHLFSLVPLLEQTYEGSHVRWLPAVLEAVVEVAVQRVLQIKNLTG